MQVLFITDVGSTGGAAISLLELILELKNLGVTPIVCTSIKDKFNDLLDQNSIINIADGHASAMNPKSPYVWKRPLKYPYEYLKYHILRNRSLKKIEKEIDLTSIDIVHTNSARNDIGCLIYNLYKIPHVIHIREFGQEDFNCCIYKRNYYKYLSSNCTTFIAISRAIYNSWICKGISEEKTQIIYNGISTNNVIFKESNSYNSKKLKLVIVGGVCSAKGQHIAIKAICNLPEVVKKNVTLDIIGWSDKRYVKKLKKLIKVEKLDDKITFQGVKNNVMSILHQYDVGLMCSKSEGFGRVTAEYLYVGLGVIAANTGASSELVDNHVTGLIYKREDPIDLADKLMKFYYDRKLLVKCATTGRTYAKRFSSRANADHILNLYKEILTNNEVNI